MTLNIIRLPEFLQEQSCRRTNIENHCSERKLKFFVVHMLHLTYPEQMGNKIAFKFMTKELKTQVVDFKFT